MPYDVDTNVIFCFFSFFLQINSNFKGIAFKFNVVSVDIYNNSHLATMALGQTVKIVIHDYKKKNYDMSSYPKLAIFIAKTVTKIA